MTPFKPTALADLIGSVTSCTRYRHENSKKYMQTAPVQYHQFYSCFIWASSGFRSNKFLALTHHTYTCLHVLLPIARHLKSMTRRSCVGLQWISGSWTAGRMFPSLIWSEQFSWPSLCPWQSISITWWSHQLLHWPQSYHRGT